MLARFIIAACICLCVSPALARERIALLIGNQDYKRGVGRLVNPLNDIRIVGDALRKVGFKLMKPVKNATRADILDALDRYATRLKKAGPDAIGFIYYSGHGIASRGTNYLIPVDIEKPSTRLLRANGVKQSEILSLIRSEAPQAAHYIVIDACRNELQGARGGKGFVAVNQQAGTLIAFATSPGRTASDIGSGSGPYAKALATELVKPGVTDLQMFSNVRFAVSSATDGDQVPWTLDGIIRRDRLMFGGASKPAPASQLRSEAAEAWDLVSKTKDTNILEAFRSQYGKANPFYDEVAKKRIFALNATQTVKRTQEILKKIDKARRRPTSGCDGVNVKLGTGKNICIKPGSGKSFKDCDVCPEMIVVPAGNFVMGSNNGSENEKPVRKVTIRAPLAVGKFEVTFAEWDACVAGGGCKHKSSDKGWGRGKRPAIDVSWNDISKQYLPWLSQKSSKTYRLLSEAEWEYVARAGTTSDYWWGDKASREFANYGKVECCDGQAKGADKWVKTSPVGSFKANAFSLYDLHGNVWEWVQDCYRNSYRDVPSDGSAVSSDGCGRRALRGGSWVDPPHILRSTFRSSFNPDYRDHAFGFRVARDLTR